MDNQVANNSQSSQLNQKVNIFHFKANYPVFILILLFLFIGIPTSYYMGAKNSLNMFLKTTKSDTKSSPATSMKSVDPTLIQTSSHEQKNTYFGFGDDGRYFLVNPFSGETKDFIPAGYNVLGNIDHQYPDYYILERHNNLYVYDIRKQNLKPILSNGKNIDIMQWQDRNVKAEVYPSISEKNKFYIEINVYDPKNYDPDSPATPERTDEAFFLNASTMEYTTAMKWKNDMSVTEGLNLWDGVSEYDSINQRIFNVHFSSSVGPIPPLIIKDLQGKKKDEIYMTTDHKDGHVIRYGYGYYYSQTEKGIKIIDPSETTPNIVEYISSNESQMSFINEIYPNDLFFDKANHHIVFAATKYKESGIVILTFDDNNKIIDHKLIPKDVLCDVDFLSDGSYIYCKTADFIKTYSIKENKIISTIPNKENDYGTPLGLFKL